MNIRQLEQRYLVNVYPRRGVTFIRGEGMYLYDDRGKKYLDMMSNYGVNIFGYNNPIISGALIEQINRLTSLHGSFTNNQRALASQRLVERVGINNARVFWSNSGSEAIEAALKFAVLATGKRRFIAAKNGYHGKTLGALSATGTDKYQKPFLPLLWQFVQVSFNDPEAMEQVINEETAAVILEPIQGEAGIIVPDNTYLSQVERICRENGVLFILDEIQTGTGRTGKFLASQRFSVKPDIVCLGKGLAAGLPVGATLVNKDIALQIPKAVHTNTFGGNPLTMRAVLAVLKLLNQDLLSHIENLGNYFIEKLKKIESEHIVDVRGKGLMVGIELKASFMPILKYLQERYILAIPASSNVVRFLPPFTIAKKHIDQLIKVLIFYYNTTKCCSKTR